MKHLLNSNHKVVIWNSDPSKLKQMGAQLATTPWEVVEKADIIFSCFSDASASKDAAGVFASNQHFDGKGYVEMTELDADTSNDIANAINGKGGRYLEAQIQGSRDQAEESTSLILAAGDKTLFIDCHSCFKSVAKTAYFLGDVGNASNMNMVLESIKGTMLANLANSLDLGKFS